MSSRYGRTGRFLVPLDHPGAVRWFVEHLHPAHGRRGRLRAGLLRRLPARFLLKKADGRTVEQVLGAEPSRTLLDEARLSAEGLRWVAVGEEPPAGRPGRHLVFLFPRGSGTRPAALLKHRTREAEGPELAREALALEELRRRGGETLAGTLPEVLGHAVSSGYEALLETVLPGTSPYLELLGPGDPLKLVGRHLEEAGAWLGRFQMETATGEGEGRCAVHGDFWHRNLLLRSAGDLGGVVDWERYRPQGPWRTDLFHYAVHYALSFPWERGGLLAVDAFARGFLEENRLSEGLRLYFRRWCEVTGRSDEELGPALRHYLREAGKEDGDAIPWRTLEELVEREEPCAFSG